MATSTDTFVEYIDNPGHWRVAERTVGGAYSEIVRVLATHKVKREAVRLAALGGKKA